MLNCGEACLCSTKNLVKCLVEVGIFFGQTEEIPRLRQATDVEFEKEDDGAAII